MKRKRMIGVGIVAAFCAGLALAARVTRADQRRPRAAAGSLRAIRVRRKCGSGARGVHRQSDLLARAREPGPAFALRTRFDGRDFVGRSTARHGTRHCERARLGAELERSRYFAAGLRTNCKQRFWREGGPDVRRNDWQRRFRRRHPGAGLRAANGPDLRSCGIPIFGPREEFPTDLP